MNLTPVERYFNDSEYYKFPRGPTDAMRPDSTKPCSDRAKRDVALVPHIGCTWDDNLKV